MKRGSLSSRARTLATLAALAVSASSLPASAAHTFDLAEKMPAHMAVMFSMAWFGVPAGDPQGKGSDKGWGNWQQEFPSCNLQNDPATCADFPGAGLQRSIASKRRPLAGIYSGTGGSAESDNRIDLMLSTLRRPCDPGARLDVWLPQLDSIKFTSAHPGNQQASTWDIAYRTQVEFLARADAAGLKSAVGLGNDATTYWHFGDGYGLTTQGARIAALTDDIVDMVALAKKHPSALRVAGKPLLMFYVDAPLLSPAEWTGLLEDARAKSGVDFYALGATTKSELFAAFDALVPWVNLGIWQGTSGATLYEHAYAWAKQSHASLVSALPNYPGRSMFGMITPGFDDYTEDWGKCTPREIPRDPAVMKAEFDYLADAKKSGVDVRGLFFQTWDDWTEGSEMEPDVTEGASKLVQARQSIGTLFGEPDDAAGDAALAKRWADYGQARNCCFAGGACPANVASAVDLSCPTGSAGQSGSGGGTNGGNGGGNSGGAGGTKAGGGGTSSGAGGTKTGGAGGTKTGGTGGSASGGTGGTKGVGPGGATSGGSGTKAGGTGGTPGASTGGSSGGGASGAGVGDTGANGGSGSSGGCGCGVAGSGAADGSLLAVGLACAGVALRRRPRRPRLLRAG